ncbi:hypothetical protein MINTMi27_15080 [Mycobacterium intracellulare]|uniref:hypothetical protein n=1 Tax=Mycobacterium intracellulare TaxID=1767 RepID=UPI00192843FA|nr:hypothetical protein [Mycobacterium intracellulare]BCP41415.1 hypothetical protein MINTMi27_15080 [Mycobacterium intracellulare]
MPKHIVITASGTGVDMWNASPPQPASVIPLLDPDVFFWQPLGNYPASVVNPQMGQSVQEGVDEMVRLWNEVYPTNSKVLMGYSQGAIVVCHFVRDELLNPKGRCYGQAKNLLCVAVWGNPCRLPGFASGNEFAGWPLPEKLDGVTTGGISGPDCMRPQDVATPNKAYRHYWADFVNTIGQGRDLYADAPVGDNPWSDEDATGAIETQIYDIVQDWWPAILEIFKDVFKLFTPAVFSTAIAIVEAIINGGMFAAAGPSAAHFTYDIQPIANFVNLCGKETAPWVDAA